MGLKCPNKNHPDWKSLVAKYGERGAVKKYIENNYDIPSPDGDTNSTRRKVEMNSEYGSRGLNYRSSSTLDSMKKHPNVAAQIIDELRRLFPEIRVFRDRIIDENGNYLDIPPGKQGRHYRSAFMSAVAWSADSALETPPHEYAHEYIDMYRNHPLVKQGIEKYGEERLVTLIARKYTGQKMSNSFNNFIDKFWRLIKNTFGAPSVVDILTDSFAKNETLGAKSVVTQGTAVHNFQEVSNPNYEDDSIGDFNEDIAKTKIKVQPIKLKEVLKAVENHFKTIVTKTDEDWFQQMNAYFNNLATSVRKATMDQYGDVYNFAGVDVSYIDFVRKVLVEPKSAINIAKKFRGEDVSLSKDEQTAINIILRLERSAVHRNVVNKSIVDRKGDLYDGQIIKDISQEEVQTTEDKRNKLLDSRNPIVKNIAQWVNKGLRYITNTRLWAKYLSGGENTVVYKILYKQLNEAKKYFAEFRYGVDDSMGAKSEWLSSGSIFDNPDATIEELNGKEITIDSNLNPELSINSVKLTNSELLALYLTNRQADKQGDLRKGLYLEKINGRNIPKKTMIKLSENQIDEIVSEIESNAELVEYIGKIDSTYNYVHEKVNSQFRIMEGYDLPKFENYFPTSHGMQSEDISKKKNVVDDFKALHFRIPDSSPIRLVDVNKVMATTKVTNASYYAYAVPVHNAKSVVRHLEKEFKGEENTKYIQSIKGTIDKIQDSGTLYSTHAETEFSSWINKMQGNFSVALLAKNLGVVLKQQVSLETATNSIDRKYIRKAGESLGPINFINPFKLLKALEFTGVKGGETWMPVEWRQVEKNADFQELIKDPEFRQRFEGVVSKEAGEAIMGKDIAQDKITLKAFGKTLKSKGKPIQISKARLMQGITIMDTLTIIRLYNAVKLETQDKMSLPKFANMTEEQVQEHNIRRLKQVVEETQPTFDQINRTGFSQSNNPIARSLTMFSSATQKMGMGLTESMIDWINNPTKDNLARLRNRTISTALITSTMLTTIDLLRHATLEGWDDDDEDKLFSNYAWATAQNSLGSIQGIGTILSIVISQLDDNPWYKTMQDPTQHIIQEGSEAIANAAKGNFGKSFKQSLGTYSKVKGLPFTTYTNISKISERITE